MFRGRWQALFGEQQRQQEDAVECTPRSWPGTPQLLSLGSGTATGPCAPGPASFMTTHRRWQWQTLDESPQSSGRNWGGPTWRDSQEHHMEERMCFFPKRGSPPAGSRHARAAKSHLQPATELGQEHTAAPSFRTPANTEHAHDDQKQILSSGL